jgi:hypothetical protein
MAGFEVSTEAVNESTNQKNYFEIPGEQRIALDSENRVSGALKKKLTETIARARRQLFAVQDSSVMRRIIYIVIRPDFNVHAEEELATFLEGHSTPEVEVVHCQLRSAFSVVTVSAFSVVLGGRQPAGAAGTRARGPRGADRTRKRITSNRYSPQFSEMEE